MPSRRLPNTTPAVVRVLKAAHDAYTNTPNAADRAISAATFAQLDQTVPTSFLKRYLKEVSEVDLALAAQAPLTGLLAQSAAQLTIFVSHFHQGLDNGIVRGTFSPGARSYYGRDVNATALPDMSSYDALVEAAEKIVSGEPARAAGEAAATFDSGATMDSGLQYDGAYVAMALPSAGEVGDKLNEFKTLRAQSQAALTKTDTEREEAMAMYPEAQALAVDICEQVEFFYRKDADASSRREKCKRWGVVYVYENGTAEPPAPTPPTPPP